MTFGTRHINISLWYGLNRIVPVINLVDIWYGIKKWFGLVKKNDSKTEWSWKLEIRNGISPFDVDENASGDTLSALNHILNVQTRIIFYSLAKWTEICAINLFSCDMSRHNEVKVSNGIGFWAHVIILHLKID